MGASYVLGIDANRGATVSFIDQASFCRETLRPAVDFMEASPFQFAPPQPFEIMRFCRVLYRFENIATGIAEVRSFVADGGHVVRETASEPMTQIACGISCHSDTTTQFVPSPAVLLTLVEGQGIVVGEERANGTRTILALSAEGPPQSGGGGAALRVGRANAA